jgi:segregation and condensation protein B
MSEQQDTNMRLLEAMLFASQQPLSTRELHERMPDGADVGGLLMALKAHYEGRGVNLVELDGSWAFRTSPDLGESLQMQKEVQRKLSRAALETLAIVAYHQPVTRAEIENIRGVITHKGTLDILMEEGWVKPGRRRETPGRPLTWVTTTTFLDQFGLESMMDLPGLDEMKASGLLDRRPAIENIASGELFANDDSIVEEDSDEDDEEDDDSFEEEDEEIETEELETA